MPAHIISCRPTSCGGYLKGDLRVELSESLRELARIGFRHVEYNIPAPHEWKERKDELAALGLRAASVSFSGTLSEPETVPLLAVAAQAARFFGAKIVFYNADSGGSSREECYRILREMGEIAAAHDVTIALETHPDLVTNGDVAAATMQGTRHPRVRLNYDSANVLYAGADGMAELKKFLPWLAAVHLKEYDPHVAGGAPGLHEGQGQVNFPELFRLCLAAGFHGPFTIEIKGITGERFTRAQAIARIENSWKYLQSIGAVDGTGR